MIITLTGANNFMIRCELNQLKNSFLESYGDMGYEKLEGDEVDNDRLIEAVHSLPFLMSRKLIILLSPSAQKQFLEDADRILKGVPDTTDLIVVEPKLDKRSSYFKVLKSNTDYREYGNMDIRELSNWIVQYAKQQQGSISAANATYLVERVGINQQQLANEIDKLITYKKDIDRTEINLLTEATPQSTVFELLDAAFAGNKKRVVEVYKEQRALKIEPQQIIAMIAWQLHVLATIKAAGQRSVEEISSSAKLNPYVVRKSLAIAKKTTLDKVKRLIAKALKLDIRMKSENIDADDSMLEYLLAISS